LIDPQPDGIDLFRSERAIRRHLQPSLRSAHSKEQPASPTVARNNGHAIGADTIRQRIPPPIQSQATHLLQGSVTTDTVLLQDRPHLAPKVDFGTLRRYCRADQADEDNRY
jgi:hypothetical protein